MAEQALVIEDYFSEGTQRMQMDEAAPTHKDSGVVEAASTKPEDREEQQNGSHKEQDKDQQRKMTTEQDGSERPPAAKEATDFLPFRRSVVETDTLLE